MSALVMVLLALVALWVVLAASAVWMAVIAFRRFRQLTRRVVDRGILSVKARALPPGRGRQVAGLRLELRDAVDRTRRVLDDATARNCPLGELPGLFRRIESLAGSVDAELRILEGDPDAEQRARLAAVRQRSADVVAMTARIRRAVSGVHADLSGGAFRSLQGEVDLEVRALRAGVAASTAR